MGDTSDEELFITQNSFKHPINEHVASEDLVGVLSEEIRFRLKPRNIITGDEELEKRKEVKTPTGTKINTEWCLRTWTQWATERNNLSGSNRIYTSSEKFVDVKVNISEE